MSIAYDPLAFRTLVARPGEVSYKFWAVNKLLRDMAAAGVITLQANETEPSDLTVIWLDINSPEIEGGVPKVWDGAAWVVLTPFYFYKHIAGGEGGFVTDAELAGYVAGLIGVTLQAWAANLDSWSALATSAKENTGAAATLDAAHVAAVDPHPQYLTAAEGSAAFQPLDSDLTAIAALSTTSFGRALLALADGAALRSASGLVIGADVQAYDADLTAWAGVNPSSYSTTAQIAAAYQPLDSDLTAIAALSTTSFGRGLLALADAAAARTTLGLGTLATQSGTFSGTHSGASSGTNTGDQTITLTGDVTGSGTGSFAATLATVNSNIGSWGLAASVAQFTVNAKGLITAAANVAISIASTAISDSTSAGRAMLTAATAAAQTALLSAFVGDSGSGGTKGLVPAPASGDASKFLRGDGTFASVSGSVSDGDKGDITVSSSGAVWTLDDAVAETKRFTPLGTGATNRTIRSKLLEQVSVFDYGAVGDGSTDDAAAFQAAITYIESLSKATEGPAGRVFAPAGYKYKIGSSLTISKPLHFWCGGFMEYTPTTGSCIVAGASFVGGRNTNYDIYIAGMRASNGNSSLPTSVNSSGSSGLEVRNCQFSRFKIGKLIAFTNAGLYLNASNDIFRSTVTITIATPGVITWTAHGRAAGDIVQFSTTGALPSGLNTTSYYYIISAGLTANTFQVSATLGGAAINTTGSQSGVHTARGGQNIQDNTFDLGEIAYNGIGLYANSDDAGAGSAQVNRIDFQNIFANYYGIQFDDGTNDDTSNNIIIGNAVDACAPGGTAIRLRGGQYNKFVLGFLEGTISTASLVTDCIFEILNDTATGVAISNSGARNWFSLAGLGGTNVSSDKYSLSDGNLAVTGTLSGGAEVKSVISGANGTFSMQRIDAHGSGAYVGLMQAYGKDSAGNTDSFARMDFVCDTNTSGSEAGSFRVTTMVSGSLAERCKFAAGLSMTGATGGDKGAGTINATAVYDDNVLLTCYVLELARLGAIDLDAWSKRGKDGYHGPAQKFAETRFDELDPSSYASKWKSTGYLPGLPSPDEFAENPLSTGDLAQRLWETVELQAVHIDNLNSRLMVLENASIRTVV